MDYIIYYKYKNHLYEQEMSNDILQCSDEFPASVAEAIAHSMKVYKLADKKEIKIIKVLEKAQSGNSRTIDLDPCEVFHLHD